MLGNFDSWFVSPEERRQRDVAIAKAMLAKLQAMAREQAAEQASREATVIRLPDPAMFTATEILKLNALRQSVRSGQMKGDTASFGPLGWEAYLKRIGLL